MNFIGRFGIIVLALVFLTSPTTSVSAQPRTKGYKCVDTNGRIEYRELALDSMTCTLLRPVAKSGADPEQTMNKLREQVEATEQQTAAAPANAEQQRATNCERAQANADILQGERDVMHTTADGQKVVLDAKARAEALAQTQKDVDYWCN